MKPLSQNDCRALLSTLEKIYGIMNSEQFPAGVLSAIKQLLPCNTICYNEIVLPNSMTTWITEPANALPGSILREAFMRHYSEHPALAHGAQTGDGGSHRISDFISFRQFHDLALYNEYYRRSNVEYQLLTALMLAPGRMTGIALDRDSADFTENERLILDLLRPHLMQAYRNAQTLDMLKRVIEAQGQGVIAVSRSGPVRLASDDAWRILGKYFKISATEKSLPEMLNNWVSSERSRFSTDFDIPSPPIPLVVSKGSRKLIVRFLWGGKAAEQDALLLEEENGELLSGLGYESNLTSREAEILTWLSQGKTNTEIGLALSISPRTVKKHLEHIYSKLQVHRRSAAVARTLPL